MKDLINWLLESPPWIEYRVRLDLLGQTEKSPEVISAKRNLLKNSQIKEIIEELQNWPGQALKGHKESSHPLHKLTFLADIGLNIRDPGIDLIINKILTHKSKEGIFQIFIDIPKHFGGTGEGMFTWMLCDAPLVLYSLIKLGLKEDLRVVNAVNHLVGLISENGWRCNVSPDIKFRGPGKKDDPCPYANLLMLKLLSQTSKWIDSREAKIGVDTILSLWDKSQEKHPYLFYMGTDFRKLKAPLIWYDILHLLDVLSLFPWIKNDPRAIEMEDILKLKADSNGRFTPESVYTKLNGWEFSQKKEPSQWITFLACRILEKFK